MNGFFHIFIWFLLLFYIEPFIFEDKGVCPVGGRMCDVGGEPLTDSRSNQVYAPVPGYPNERSCVRCRFFLSGPAWLPGLQAHFNTISYEAHERAERHNDLLEAVTRLENLRDDCQREGRLFAETHELERLSQRYEAEAEAMGKLVNDMQATYHLIARSLASGRCCRMLAAVSSRRASVSPKTRSSFCSGVMRR